VFERDRRHPSQNTPKPPRKQDRKPALKPDLKPDLTAKGRKVRITIDYHVLMSSRHPISASHMIEQRRRPERDWSIAAIVDAVEHDGRRKDRAIGRFMILWQELVPTDLARHLSVTGLRGGVLSVVASSASARYQMESLLRAGLEQELRRRFTGTLARVRITLGEGE
jgi:hypothetical protein